MARTFQKPAESPYYPPRERWYGRVFYLLSAARRGLYLDRIPLPRGMSAIQFVFSIVVPGFAFHVLGRRILSLLSITVYCIATVIFVAAIGFQFANICFGLMISVHVTSIVYLEGYALRDRCRFGYRVALAVLTLLTVWLLVYLPPLNFAERHWFMPLRIGERVVVVSRSVNPESLKHGDWAAYRVSGVGEHGMYVRGGFALGPVLAMSGDRVEFGTDTFKVNGEPRPLQGHMPTTGELLVPEKHWFLWPEFVITAPHGNANGIDVTRLLVNMATVSEDQFVGRPFKTWFGRRQALRTAAETQAIPPPTSPGRGERR